MKQSKHKILMKSVALVLGLSAASTIQANEPPKPCSDSQYRQFDFWIGKWEVKDTAGKIVGHNDIFPILNGCALSENWASVTGYTGKSYNFYDKANNKWHQTWIDIGGSPLYLDGAFKDGAMVLQGKGLSPKGEPILHKIAWTQDDKGVVKQHWTTSKDNGKTWEDSFVGFYRKKP